MVLHCQNASKKCGDGIANSVDPDQTAPRSSLFWVCTVCSDLSVPILRTFTVGVENVRTIKIVSKEHSLVPKGNLRGRCSRYQVLIVVLKYRKFSKDSDI